ncbi:MAG: hypothetical protein F6J87_01110 [Spirulina sp. SIO3F2]|nr:hypothetical protein [Spirulina sp. SIO3F2]
MTPSLRPQPTLDLAGYYHPQPNYFHTKQRLKYLAESYLAPQVLTQRLQDLPQQFEQPHQRPWERFDWQAISPEQIVGVDRELFASLIAASAEVEAPIRDYAQISRDYLQQVHPEMSRFISGSYDAEGKLIEVGVWEKEERQHAPTFCKLYQQLVGEPFTPHSNTITTLEPEIDLGEDLYRHAIRRITTEWSAVSLYLWLMAHSTGALQQAIAQPMQDEVNHLAKFWGMTRWGFADQTFNRLVGMTAQFVQMFDHHQGDRTTSSEILQIGNLRYGAELAYIFTRVLRQICDWNKHLQPEILEGLFGLRPRLRMA